MAPALLRNDKTGRAPLRVLYFEDQMIDIKLALAALQFAGFEVAVDVAVTEAQVLDRLSATSYDAILSDFQMPLTSGMELFRAVRASGCSTPFILVTGSMGEETAVECLKEGVADVVLKDSLVRLPMAVQRALEEQRLRRERSRAEEALRRSEAKYRSLFDRAPVGIIRVRASDGCVLEANRALADMLGYHQPASLAGVCLCEQVCTDAAECHTCRTQTRLMEREVRWRRQDGSPLDISLSGQVVEEDRAIRTIEFIARDITHLKRLDQELRARNRQLEQQYARVEQASRMKSDFLANMSHELRSPLNGIIGFGEFLCDGKAGQLTDKQRDLAGRIASSGRHLLQLINSVLDLSKVEAGHLEFRAEPVVLSEIVGEVVAALGSVAAQKDVLLETCCDPEVDQVHCDPTRLKQVLYNYISNALKFSDRGGRVAVRSLPESEREFRLEVSDTGIGIAETDLPKLFVAFQQLDAGKGKRFQGTGLGLALTRHLVESQGGRVGVRSKLSQGSTFYCVLPRSAADAPPQAVHSGKEGMHD